MNCSNEQLTFLISFIISDGSIADVVFIDQVNLRDLGFEPGTSVPVPALGPAPSCDALASEVLPPLDTDDR